VAHEQEKPSCRLHNPHDRQRAPLPSGHAAQNGSASGDGAAAGGGASRKARQVGGVQGYDAQQRALRPDAGSQGGEAPAAGPLSPAKLKRAQRYNEKREGRQGAAWITDLQGLVGAPATGSYDHATDQAVATWQGGHGLRVDGEVGPKTERKVSAALPGRGASKQVVKAPAAVANGGGQPAREPRGENQAPPPRDPSGVANGAARPPVGAGATGAPAVDVDAVTGAAPVTRLGRARRRGPVTRRRGPRAQASPRPRRASPGSRRRCTSGTPSPDPPPALRTEAQEAAFGQGGKRLGAEAWPRHVERPAACGAA